VEIGDGWVAAYRLIPQGGRVVVGELRLYPSESTRDEAGSWSAERLGNEAAVPAGGLTADVLRKVPVGEHRQFIRERLDELREDLGAKFFDVTGFDDLAPDTTKLDALTREASRRPGHEGRPDLFYARIAAIYVERVDAGNGRPIREIAAELGRSPALCARHPPRRTPARPTHSHRGG
jgi:hypothetical protein